MWVITVADFTITSQNGNKTRGELRFDKSVYTFDIVDKKDKGIIFTLYNANNPELQSLLRRVLNKATYCISCEACEVECPTGALSVLPNVKINKDKCVHCHKCLNFHERGCVVATSVATTVDTKMKAKTGIDRYNTFGLKEEWLDIFFADPEYYFIGNNSGLGTKQVPAMTNWLKEAEIIDDKKDLTELGKILQSTYIDNPDLVWEIIWVNLVRNSFICHWFATTIKPGAVFNKKSLVDLFIDEYQSLYGKRTVENAITALLSTFSGSPIGERFGLYEIIDKNSATRTHCNEKLNNATVAYSVYKHAEVSACSHLAIADFYVEGVLDGVSVEFGYVNSMFKQNLRNLNSMSNQVLSAELNMGLDNINLREDIKALDALKYTI